MLVALHPTYELRVEIKDIPRVLSISDMVDPKVNLHKYYDGLNGKTGCDEVLAAVRKALTAAGIDASVSLNRFEHKV